MVTTPMTWPYLSSRGPPELPGLTLASVTMSAPSVLVPLPEEMIPRVTLIAPPRRSISG
jgi:hypothetical protein